MSIDLIVLGFASVNGFHVQGVTQYEVDLLARTQIGQPIPREDAFHRHDNGRTERSLLEMNPDRLACSDAEQSRPPDSDAQVHGSRVQINSAVM